MNKSGEKLHPSIYINYLSRKSKKGQEHKCPITYVSIYIQHDFEFYIFFSCRLSHVSLVKGSFNEENSMKTEKDINCQALHWPCDGICQQELQKCIFHTNTLFPGAQRDLPMSIVFWADIFLGHLVDISAGRPGRWRPGGQVCSPDPGWHTAIKLRQGGKHSHHQERISIVPCHHFHHVYISVFNRFNDFKNYPLCCWRNLPDFISALLRACFPDTDLRPDTQRHFSWYYM